MAIETKYKVKLKLKKGDEVIVVAGKNNGESGKIESVDKKKNRIYVAGLNLAKKHTKPSMEDQAGGIIDKVMSLHASNVMLLDPKHNKPTRIGYKIEGGNKVRYAKKSGTVLDN